MFNCIIYGEAGSGKTPLCGTLEETPQTSPCLFVDVDRGAMSVNVKVKPTIVVVNEWSKMQVIYTFLRKAAVEGSAEGWGNLAEFLTKETGGVVPVKEYKSVVVDSGTELEYVCRQVVMKEEIAKKPEHDLEAPEQRDYLKTGERMKRLVRAFRDLPIAFVMVAGVRDLKDDRDGSLRHFPAFQPQLSKDLIRMVDLIMYMGVIVEKSGESTKWVRTLQTQLSQRIIARDRSQKLDPMMKEEFFHFRDIVTKVTS